MPLAKLSPPLYDPHTYLNFFTLNFLHFSKLVLGSMDDFLTQYYNWVKAFHVIAVMAWMAGLLYLPRLFVYHTQVAVGSDEDARFQTMEQRLLRIIMNPAMIVSWLLGLIMIWTQPNLFEFGWMHTKMTAVILMTVMHMVFAKWRKGFVNGTNSLSEKTFRIWNEAPAVLMVIIVIMAIAEPF